MVFNEVNMPWEVFLKDPSCLDVEHTDGHENLICICGEAVSSDTRPGNESQAPHVYTCHTCFELGPCPR